MRHLKFWLAHAVPRRHVTEYGGPGGRRFVSVWRQWGAVAWDHVCVEVASHRT